MSLPIRPLLAADTPYGAPQLDVPIALNVNENPFAPSEAMVASIGRAVEDAARGLNRYPDREALALRAALADYLRSESHVSLALDQVWPANGSNEIMSQILDAFAGPGRTVLTAVPSYSMYPEYARNANADFVTVDRTASFGLDLDALGEAITTHRPGVIVLASPNNPTGTALTLDEIRAILDLAAGNGPLDAPGSDAMVVIDEAYGEFRREGTESALTLLDRAENLIVTRTMSKAFGAAGLRLGYCAAATPVIDQLRIVRLPYHLSAITQAAACAALGHAEEQMSQVGLLRSERDRLTEALRGEGLAVADSDANFVMFGQFEDRHRIFQGLLDAGILIREVGPPGWLRVSIGTPEENDTFYSRLMEIL